MRLVRRLVFDAVVLLMAVPSALAQVHPIEQMPIELSVDSGLVENSGDARAVIFSEVVAVPDVSWIRLKFDQAMLGAAPGGAQPTVLRITSLLDGATQHMRAAHVLQWQHSSAYFNGNMVLVEIVADPGAAASRLVIREGMGGLLEVAIEETICGSTDDRELSNDARTGRLVPIGCTGWLIDDANHCFLTAGHCTGSADVMEFNVPLSNGSGTIQHPGPEDQYAVDPASMQSNGGQGVGNDWAYFGCFANTETGLTAYEAQGSFLVLAASAPPVSGQQIRITGYGTTSFPVPNEWNQVQKTHVGPYDALSGTAVSYVTDTTGGNSGSPVINEDDGLAIGIHTHGGCNSGGGANNGTAIQHAALQEALANPQGVCIPNPPLAFTYPNGLPELLNPDGDTIRVEVSGQNDGTPQPGTGLLHYDIGDGEVVVT
ncbi:MAG: trypsin-like serine peptidase, partial [Planctomycetota bacterium]